MKNQSTGRALVGFKLRVIVLLVQRTSFNVALKAYGLSDLQGFDISKELTARKHDFAHICSSSDVSYVIFAASEIFPASLLFAPFNAAPRLGRNTRWEYSNVH